MIAALAVSSTARKRLSLAHTSRAPVTFRVEADFTGTGHWAEVTRLEVPAGRTHEHRFPDAFSAYWLRLVADQDTTAIATFIYE